MGYKLLAGSRAPHVATLTDHFCRAGRLVLDLHSCPRPQPAFPFIHLFVSRNRNARPVSSLHPPFEDLQSTYQSPTYLDIPCLAITTSSAVYLVAPPSPIEKILHILHSRADKSYCLQSLGPQTKVEGSLSKASIVRTHSISGIVHNVIVIKTLFILSFSSSLPSAGLNCSAGRYKISFFVYEAGLTAFLPLGLKTFEQSHSSQLSTLLPYKVDLDSTTT